MPSDRTTPSTILRRKSPQPPNSFMIYRKAVVRSPRVAELVQKSGLHISKVVAELWRAESAQVRQEYRLKGLQAQIEHSMRYPDYKLSQDALAHFVEETGGKLAIFSEGPNDYPRGKLCAPPLLLPSPTVEARSIDGTAMETEQCSAAFSDMSSGLGDISIDMGWSFGDWYWRHTVPPPGTEPLPQGADRATTPVYPGFQDYCDETQGIGNPVSKYSVMPDSLGFDYPISNRRLGSPRPNPTNEFRFPEDFSFDVSDFEGLLQSMEAQVASSVPTDEVFSCHRDNPSPDLSEEPQEIDWDLFLKNPNLL